MLSAVRNAPAHRQLLGSRRCRRRAERTSRPGPLITVAPPDFVNHDPPFPGSPEGAEGLCQAAMVIRAAVPDWRSDADHCIAEGDLVVEHFHASGGIHLFRIAGDRIVERWGLAASWSTEGEPSQGFGGSSPEEHLTGV